MRTKNRGLHELAAHGERRRRRWPWLLGALAVVLAVGAIGFWLGTGRGPSPAAAPPSTTTTTAAVPLTVTATTPASGATGVASDTALTVSFSADLTPAATGAAAPTLAPPVAGSWQLAGRRTLQFEPSAPFVPGTAEVLTIPGGPAGIRDAAGAVLASTQTVSFTVAPGSEERLEQLLALTSYLPLSFTPEGPPPAPAQAALPQTGSFAWRWTGLPASLTSQWVEGQSSEITKGAVMALESQSGLTVDAIAGPRVWAVLLADAAKGTTDPQPYDYVYVTKVLPENLTLWVNGVPKFADVPVNTGAPGADTVDGTYEVFEHVTASEMKGTNPDGTTYDDKGVPWASYFNGGDALHEFPRASYGSPQSLGCVEMPESEAAAVYRYTPIGTIVNVVP